MLRPTESAEVPDLVGTNQQIVENSVRHSMTVFREQQEKVNYNSRVAGWQVKSLQFDQIVIRESACYIYRCHTNNIKNWKFKPCD